MSTSLISKPPTSTSLKLNWRRQPLPEDPEKVRRLTTATGFFNAEEVDIAVELVEVRLEQGKQSGYFFIFAEQSGHLVGYTCFGPVPLTRGSFDVYWIAVDPAFQGRGIGRKLIDGVEKDVRGKGARLLWVETSTRPGYRPTRAFYEQLGFRLEARLQDFYAPGDGKAIYCRAVTS